MRSQRDSHHDEPSESLISQAVAGSREAQQSLLVGCSAQVRRMLHRMVGPGNDLDDLQQMAYMRILAGLPRFRRESSFSTWLGGVCVNVAKDHFRKKGVRSVVHFDPALDAREQSNEARSDPQRMAAINEDLRLCNRALEALSANQRLAVSLSLQGFGVDEIAKMMRAARSTTRLRLYYGRKRLAAELAKLTESEGRR